MDPLNRPAIVLLSESGWETAKRLVRHIPEAEIHGLAGRVSNADVFFEHTASHLQSLFLAGREIIGICAAAILIRSLGAVLSDKQIEPGVTALSDDGEVAVPLLGGHHGANRRAREIAGIFNGAAAITTAGDVRFGVALDDPPEGYVLDNPTAVKDFTARLLAGGHVRFEGDLPWLRASSLPWHPEGKLRIRETIEKTPDEPTTLNYIARKVVVGVGCERSCDPDEVLGLVHRSLEMLSIDPRAVGLVVSIHLKADEPAVHFLSEKLDCPARFFPPDVLEKEAPRLSNPSETVFAETGCHGVAEGAVLAALGPEGELAVEKQKSRRATCAIGIREEGPWREPLPGNPQGQLFVVGIGPGKAGWRTSEAEKLIAQSSDLVGYSYYIEMLGPLSKGKTLHPYALGEEEERVRVALNLAMEGRTVALVCSGDPGIYAMASLIYEMMERGEKPEWRKLHVQVSPGVSAMQAAAARSGAPLGNDFCAISLSDLLTPWEVIEKRIRAASEGDFTIAFYNPVSNRRRTQLLHAKEILLKHRLPETPVILARNLGREGETMDIVRLIDLDIKNIDMLTVVIVGSSETRLCQEGLSQPRVYSPRGYARKKAAPRQSERNGGTNSSCMKVHFIGAGPGACDLITLRGARLIEKCPVCLYAGSLVPEEVVALAPKGARVIDTSSLNLDEIMAEIGRAKRDEHDVARVHSGDPSVFGAIAEQMRRLEAMGIDYDVTPGVTAYSGAAAELKRELTLPDVSQTLIVTRTSMKSSSMPEGEQLEILARSKATLAIHLSARNLRHIEESLIPHYGPECPVVVAYRATWPDQQIIHGTLSTIREKVERAKITRTALIFVGEVFGEPSFEDSALYHPDHRHVLRPGKEKTSQPE